MGFAVRLDVVFPLRPQNHFCGETRSDFGARRSRVVFIFTHRISIFRNAMAFWRISVPIRSRRHRSSHFFFVAHPSSHPRPPCMSLALSRVHPASPWASLRARRRSYLRTARKSPGGHPGTSGSSEQSTTKSGLLRALERASLALELVLTALMRPSGGSGGSAFVDLLMHVHISARVLIGLFKDAALCGAVRDALAG